MLAIVVSSSGEWKLSAYDNRGDVSERREEGQADRPLGTFAPQEPKTPSLIFDKVAKAAL